MDLSDFITTLLCLGLTGSAVFVIWVLFLWKTNQPRCFKCCALLRTDSWTGECDDCIQKTLKRHIEDNGGPQ